MWKLILIMLLFTLFKCCNGQNLPVFLIDHDNVMGRFDTKATPLKLVSGQLLRQMATEAFNRSQCVIFFIEEVLSVEDFRCKDSLGTPFNHVSQDLNATRALYLPTVSEPYEVLSGVLEPYASTIYSGTGDKLYLLDQHRYFYVFLKDDAGRSRVENLRKHDKLMKELYSTMRMIKQGPVVAFYTGKYNPAPKQILRSEPDVMMKENDGRGYFLSGGHALALLNGIYTTKPIKLDAPKVLEEGRTDERISIYVQYGQLVVRIRFIFSPNDRTYLIRGTHWSGLCSIAAIPHGTENTVYIWTDVNLQIPWNHSYYCNEPIIIRDIDGSTTIIYEYQLEPKSIRRIKWPEQDRYGQYTIYPWSEQTQFSEPIKCTRYFNWVILSGLLVTFIFLAIVMIGVIMLMNCKTPDKFDHPHQEPHVTAEERGVKLPPLGRWQP